MKDSSFTANICTFLHCAWWKSLIIWAKVSSLWGNLVPWYARGCFLWNFSGAWNNAVHSTWAPQMTIWGEIQLRSKVASMDSVSISTLCFKQVEDIFIMKKRISVWICRAGVGKLFLERADSHQSLQKLLNSVTAAPDSTQMNKVAVFQ